MFVSQFLKVSLSYNDVKEVGWGKVGRGGEGWGKVGRGGERWGKVGRGESVCIW